MKKIIKIERYSNVKLRIISVLLAAHQILHMEKNGLIGDLPSNEEDVKIDIEDAEMTNLEASISKIDMKVSAIYKSFIIHKKDEPFLFKSAHKIIETFLATGILKVGVSPHLAFCTMLFVYFVDGSSRKHELIFKPLCDAQIYHDVFEKLEESKLFNWNIHTESVIKSLKEGVGFSCQTYNEKFGKNIKWHIKLLYNGIKHTAECEAVSQFEAKRIIEKMHPFYQVYLVCDFNDHRRNIKKYPL